MKKKQRIHSCNVLESRASERQLWHFHLASKEIKLEQAETIPLASPLPEKLIEKDWHELYQPKVNIAWLPADQVFLRVVQLPAADDQELVSMLEFQLEKISPLPPHLIVWSLEILPSAVENMKTALVCIVPREVVEQYLGTLEGQKFLADRLEIPQLNQIVADGIREDGAWIYLGSGLHSEVCTVAWWLGGTLQQVQLIRLPGLIETAGEGTTATDPAARAKFLEEQLMQTAWAGELEGWLQLPVRWHLVGEEKELAEWQPLVQAWTDETVDTALSLQPEALARFCATRLARGTQSANLLPAEFATRYRQQYIDRLWMRGLGAVVTLYIFGVIIYMIALQIFTFRQGQVEQKVASLANTYTNVLELKERTGVLQEQLNLKYAALDCWKVASELLPEDFTLTWMVFGRGRTLELHGTAPPDQGQKVTDYNEALRNIGLRGQPLFRSVSGPNIINRPGSQNLTWTFQCELNVADTE